jgi:hypothetical protein
MFESSNRTYSEFRMLAQAMWLTAICLEALLLFRLWRAQHLRTYLLFSCYLIFVISQDVLRYLVAHSAPTLYPGTFWSTEFIGVFAGCGVVAEVCSIALARYPGVAKIARNLMLLAFSLIVGKIFFTALQGTSGWSVFLILQLERDMRFVQILAILCLLLVLTVYSIPVNRNLRGIMLGYGLFLSFNLVDLSFLERLGGRAQFVASGIQSSAYLAALCIWAVFLWSKSPQPQRRMAGEPAHHGYSDIVSETQERLATMHSEVTSTIQLR